MANFKYHTSCPKCGSSDALAVYDDESVYCWSCTYTTLSEEMKEQYKKERKGSTKKKEKKLTDKIQKVDESKLKPVITEEQKQEIKDSTWLEGSDYRGIKDWVLKYFGVRTTYDDDGDVLERYYPCTYDGELSGYKIRSHPKEFRSIGRTGKECELFGQFRFTTPNKYCMIVGGEEDQLAAYQMLREYQVKKGTDNFDAIPVVSPTIGEVGSAQQLALQYKFFDQFERIILCYDNDEAGQKATEKAVGVLPKGKVYLMSLRHKDPNEYLLEGDESKFVQDFFAAKKYTPTGIVGSNQISEAMREELAVEKLPLPPFMHKLQKMMAGGIPLGRIVNLGSASGTGKSTLCDEILYYWLFHSPHRVGIVTLESTVGQYGIKLLSRHVSKKIELLDQDVALEFVDSEEVKKKEFELFNTPEGEPRFYLVDDRDGGVDNIKDSIENLIIACGCKVIVLDPIQDCIGTLPQEEQEGFMAWQKGMVKSHGVTFINVSHTRKTAGGQKAGSIGGDLNEEDLHGSSAIYKSAACNLIFGRNKEAEDDLERNTTIMKATKIRWTGMTGIAGKYYYDAVTHTLHDLDDYLEKNPELAMGF